jgi:5-methylcytosine-specific restriction endonuclease McrA
MTSVLVLNASLEHLHYVPLRRAVTLLLARKAEIVEASGRRLRAATLDLPEPRVIRLLSYVFVPFRHAHATRRKILLRDGRCQYCGATTGPLTVDHLLPRSRGGKTTWENCVAACLPCNQRKGDRTPQESRMRLLHGVPSRPRFWLPAASQGAPSLA